MKPTSGPALPGLSPGPIDEQSVFRTLFAAYPDALLLVDNGGTIVKANPAAAQLLDYTLEQLVGMSVDVLVPDSIRPRHAAYRDAYAKQPRARPMGTQMELVAKRRDGSEVMVEIALSPLQDHGLPYVVAAIRGIGAYPRVKQALQRARYAEHVAQLGRMAVDMRDTRELLRQVPVVAAEALQVDLAVVYLLEPNGLAFRVAACVGTVPEEPVGALLPNRADTSPGHVLARGEPVVTDNYQQETRFEVPARYTDAGLVSAMSVPLLSDRGRAVGVLAVRCREPQRFAADEITFVQALASMLATSLQRAETEEALSHAQRLESVGQLTGGIAHDFNNLLTVIQGNLQVLEELPAVEGDPYAQQLVGAATRASRRAAELTSKLLAFSRRQVLTPEPIDVPTLLHSLADMLRRTLDQRIRIHVEVDAACPACLADPSQLESALLNIAINARDAMPDGGELRFTGAPSDRLPANALGDIDALVPQAHVAISVADTGSGMTEAVKERAIEPFFTTKDVGRGTGLGLSTVYGFLRQSKGAIAIDSAIGQGTTVTLCIPRVLQAPADAGRSASGEEGVPAGLRVLLVEDDAEVSAVARKFLATLGCEVVSCVNGEQALPVLASERAFDLLLSDVALGAGMRGTELALRATRQRPGLPVLLVSGFSTELLDADRDMPPEWELLRKPYSRQELARAIASLVRRKD
jgi:PAS domain S-box-containing protein